MQRSVRSGDRVLVEVPRQPFGDGYLYSMHDHHPAAALDTWQRGFDTYYKESAFTPTFCPFSLHPYVSGRPGRSEVLSELIGYMKSHQGVWFATAEEIAQTVLDCAAERELATTGTGRASLDERRQS